MLEDDIKKLVQTNINQWTNVRKSKRVCIETLSEYIAKDIKTYLLTKSGIVIREGE